jgi:curved DNA-binding protein CbpA
MKGTLTEQPLAELVREISYKELSGTLRIEHDRAQTAVYFDSGQVIYAASNLRTLRLREYLIKSGLVSEKDLAILPNNLSDPALAAALTAGGWIGQKEVDGLLAALVADVLRVALLWTEGNWEFNDRARLGDPVRVQIDCPALLREAAQRMPLSFVSQRFQNPAEMILRVSEVPLTSNFLPTEGFVLSRLDQPTKLDDLVALSGLPEQDAYRVIYGLALSGLLEREFWESAFRADKAKPKPKPKEQSSAAAAATTTSDDTGQGGSRWTVVSAEEDLEKFLMRLGLATNYYEVIELPATASAHEIKETYYALARRYHPDRFHLQSGTELHAKLSSAFARITQAYETLTDPTARSTYDQKLERSKRLGTVPNPASTQPKADSGDDVEIKGGPDRAEQNFREGLGALKEGRNKAAVTYLAAAARLEPREARYRAYYGSALATSEDTRKLAEHEIQAAVKLDPQSATFRTMLAELYFDLKFDRRAKTEVDRALALDPNNAQAQALLRKLENSRKVG